jgi:hypothetical protein
MVTHDRGVRTACVHALVPQPQPIQPIYAYLLHEHESNLLPSSHQNRIEIRTRSVALSQSQCHHNIKQLPNCTYPPVYLQAWPTLWWWHPISFLEVVLLNYC